MLLNSVDLCKGSVPMVTLI